MPIIDFDEEEAPVEPNFKITPERYQGAVVETRYDTYNSLSTYIRGYKLQGDYYNRVAGEDDASASFQADVSYAYSQFDVVRGMQVVVTSPFTHSQRQDDQQGFVSQATIVVFGIITPKQGDLFIMDDGRGESFITQVASSPRRTSVYMEAAFELDIKVKERATAEAVHAIEARVQHEGVFDIELFRNGFKPILNKGEYQLKLDLRKLYTRLLNLYMKDFFNRQYSTLCLPYQQMRSYDPYLTSFFKKTVEVRAHPDIVKIKLLNVEMQAFSKNLTLFDAILNLDEEYLFSVHRKAQVRSVMDLTSRPQLFSALYSGLGGYVCVSDDMYDTNTQYRFPPSGLDIGKAGTRQYDMRSILPELDLTGMESRPDEGSYIHRIVLDDCYVFTQAFYNDDPGQSQLEHLVRTRIAGEPINLEMLKQIAEHSVKFDNIERFYYVPIILNMIDLADGVF